MSAEEWAHTLSQDMSLFEAVCSGTVGLSLHLPGRSTVLYVDPVLENDVNNVKSHFDCRR